MTEPRADAPEVLTPVTVRDALQDLLDKRGSRGAQQVAGFYARHVLADAVSMLDHLAASHAALLARIAALESDARRLREIAKDIRDATNSRRAFDPSALCTVLLDSANEIEEWCGAARSTDTGEEL